MFNHQFSRGCGSRGRFVVFIELCGANTPILANFQQLDHGRVTTHRVRRRCAGLASQAGMSCARHSNARGGCTEQEQIVFLLQLLLGLDRCIVAPSLSIQVGLLVLESSLQGGAVYTYISHRNILHKKSMLLRTATKSMFLTQKAPLPSGGRMAEAESA